MRCINRIDLLVVRMNYGSKIQQMLSMFECSDVLPSPEKDRSSYFKKIRNFIKVPKSRKL